MLTLGLLLAGKKRGIRSSGPLFLFWVLSVFCGGFTYANRIYMYMDGVIRYFWNFFTSFFSSFYFILNSGLHQRSTLLCGTWYITHWLSSCFWSTASLMLLLITSKAKRNQKYYSLFQIIMLNMNDNIHHSIESFTRRELIVPVNHYLFLVRGYGLEGIQEAAGNNRFVGSQQQRQIEGSCSKIRQALGIFTETRNEVSFIFIFSFPLKFLNI